MTFNLLEFSRGGGCGCKLDPQRLKEALTGLNGSRESRLLIDFADRDDAAVLETGNGDCIIQSVDFFLPVVSDPRDFGRIAACNALSDIYAMGGKPVMALSMLGWPVDRIPLEAGAEVLKGAEDICLQAGIGISGGHSIETSEPLFGLSVTGMASVKHLKRKQTCIPGDKLYLTKPLGLGLLSNALKHGALTESGYKLLIQYATKLNILGVTLGGNASVSAMTDVTGFGLLGHLSEMLGSNKGALLRLDQIPVIAEAREIAMKMMYPNITTGNYNFVKDRTDGLNGLEFLWLCDPQTSGGLLFSSPDYFNSEDAVCIGEVTEGTRIVLQN